MWLACRITTDNIALLMLRETMVMSDHFSDGLGFRLLDFVEELLSFY